MPFFHFDQNNSGGGYDADENVAPIVVIEAVDADAANDKAEELGVYFGGVSDGRDCECCGDRWYAVEDYDAKDKPDERLILQHASWKNQGSPYAHVHYADGKKLSYS